MKESFGDIMQGDSRQAQESNSELALRYLREQIMNGEMLPQEKIVESDIAGRLGISRGPVRDALKQLEVEGLVDYEQNKGCKVALLSPKDAYEVFFLRGSLEKLALEKCGGCIGDSGIFVMEEALEDMRRAAAEKNTARTVAADEIFHRQIIMSGHIDRLVKMWELLSPLNGAMFLVVRRTNELEESESPDGPRRSPWHVYEAHKALLEVCRTGTLQEELAALNQHYIGTGERIYRSFLRHGGEH